MKKHEIFLRYVVSTFMVSCVLFLGIPIKAAWCVRPGDNSIKINNFLLSVTLGNFDKSYVFFEDNPDGVNGFLSNYYESSFAYKSKINFHESTTKSFKSIMHVLAYYRILIIYKIILHADVVNVAPEICIKLNEMHQNVLKASSFGADSISVEAWWYVYGQLIHCKVQENSLMSPDDFKKAFNLEYGAFLKSEFANILYYKFFSNPSLKSVLSFIRANGIIPILCLGSVVKSVIPGDNIFGVPLNIGEAMESAINGWTKLRKYEYEIDEEYEKNIERPHALFTHTFNRV